MKLIVKIDLLNLEPPEAPSPSRCDQAHRMILYYGNISANDLTKETQFFLAGSLACRWRQEASLTTFYDRLPRNVKSKE
jgi:hypothetical protein